VRVRLALALTVIALTGCPTHPEVKPNDPVTKREPAPDACVVRTRRISPPAQGGVRPHVLAAAPSGFAVVWEESDESSRGIHFQALDVQAAPLGPAVEVADLSRGGAMPRLAHDGDGYAVLWAEDTKDDTTLLFRRIDARGKPRGDVVQVLKKANVRVLAATRTQTGFAVAWWTWSTQPPELAVSFLDAEGKARGAAVPLTRGTLIEPAVDFAAGDGADVLRVAWVEPQEGADHVLSGTLSPDKHEVQGRVDLGEGNLPSFASSGVILARLGDTSVWRTSFRAPAPVRLTEGQSPDAVGDALCLFRPAHGQELLSDELRCLIVDGSRVLRDRRVTTAPGGVLTLALAVSGPTLGVAYQTEETENMSVTLATLTCPKSSN
jgi:hypothetical protein